MMSTLVGQDHGSIYWSHVSQVEASRRSSRELLRGVRVDEKASVVAEPREVSVWVQV